MQALNSATTSLAFCIVPHKTGMQLATYTGYVSTITGSPANVECIVCRETSTVGTPDIANPLQSTTIDIAATGWATWEFLTPATLTKNKRYWIVVKGNSATNYPTMQWMTQGTPYDRVGTAGIGEFTKKHTVDGSAWTGPGVGFGFEAGFSDGSKYGYPYRAITHNLTSPNSEKGVRLFMPVGLSAPLSVAEISFAGRKAGIQWGELRAKIYVNGSLAVTSDVYPAEDIPTSSSFRFVFTLDTPVALSPGSTVDIMLTAGSLATSSNYYRLEGLGSLFGEYPNQIPFGAVLCDKSAAGVWTTDGTAFPFFSLHLTPGAEFLTSPVNRRTSTGR